MIKAAILARLNWLWAIVLVVGVVEVALQWQIPQGEPRPADWKKAARAIAAEKQPHDLVVIAPHWAGQGRMYLGQLMPLRDLGRFDTAIYDRIFEVSVGKARSNETLNLVAESETRFGNITLRRYRLPPKAEVVYSFSNQMNEAVAHGFRRREARVMIDHWFQPRWVIPIPLSGNTASLSFDNVPLDGVLRGYGIVDYRHGRHNKGGPVMLSIYVDEKKIGTHEVANFGPLAPFQFELPGDVGRVRFAVKAPDAFNRQFGMIAHVLRRPGGDR